MTCINCTEATAKVNAPLGMRWLDLIQWSTAIAWTFAFLSLGHCLRTCTGPPSLCTCLNSAHVLCVLSTLLVPAMFFFFFRCIVEVLFSCLLYVLMEGLMMYSIYIHMKNYIICECNLLWVFFFPIITFFYALLNSQVALSNFMVPNKSWIFIHPLTLLPLSKITWVFLLEHKY
jgi:hypothetical protein